MGKPLQKHLAKSKAKPNGVLSLQELVRFARTHSPFYKKLYNNLPDIIQLKDLPITPHSEYWSALGEKSQVLTAPYNGLIIRSGGTSGTPKFAAFSPEEWKITSLQAGTAFAQNNVAEGDCIANLFYSGHMYGAFIFATRFLEDCPIPVTQLPITGQTDLAEVIDLVKRFKANSVMGVPTRIVNFAEYIKDHKGIIDSDQIQKIYFSGEPLFQDQRDRIKEILPKATFHSISYASNDAGLLGYVDNSCGVDEHRAFNDYTILEILNEETLEPITNSNEEGIIVVTNLYRKLMPVIRYPVGDRGMWTEPDGTIDRKFKLLGRSNESVSICTNKIYVKDLQKILDSYKEQLKIFDFQLLTYHVDKKDGLIIRIATSLKPEHATPYDNQIIDAILKEYPENDAALKAGGLHPIKIEWIKKEELISNATTGKFCRVLDKRR